MTTADAPPHQPTALPQHIPTTFPHLRAADLRALPGRPRLRPHTFVLAGPGSVVRVGLGEQSWVVLSPAEPDIASWLGRIDGSRELADCAGAAPAALGATGALGLLASLDTIGLLDDAAVALPRSVWVSPDGLRAAAGRVAIGRGSAAAAAVMTARSRARVSIHGRDPIVGHLAHGVRSAGVGRIDVSSQAPRAGTGRRDVVALLGRSGLLRSRTSMLDEPLLATGQPYLGMEITQSCALITPLIVPGLRACLRCSWLHRSEADPAWSRLVTRAVGRPLPDLADHERHLAIGHALRLLLAAIDEAILGAADGAGSGMPRASLVDLRSGEVRLTPWLPHAACGCQGQIRAA